MAVSILIQNIIRQALQEGNAVSQVRAGWSQIREVTYMTNDITDVLWAALQIEERSLRAWATEATPHNRAERGFTDDRTGEAVCFPR